MRLIDADRVMQSIDRQMIIARELLGNDPQAQEFVSIAEQSIKQEISNAPTVDAEPVRHGKFVGTEYDGYADGYPVYCEWKCSQCGCVFEDEEPTYKYCPNCGAKMDEE